MSSKIVTFNARCVYNTGDGANNFIHRVGLIKDKIALEKPSIVAFQEVTPPILASLEDAFGSDYLFVGQMRSASYSGEGLYTAFKRDEFALIRLETFWLSPTPFIPGSRYEIQSVCPRICVTTTLLHRASGKLITVYNNHLDHAEDEARRQGMKCLFAQMKKIQSLFPSEVIILGDFNAFPTDKVMKYTAEKSPVPIFELSADIPFTYHGFGKSQQKIDYIFVSQTLKDAWTKTSAWDDCADGIYLSDHYPVCAEFDL